MICRLDIFWTLTGRSAGFRPRHILTSEPASYCAPLARAALKLASPCGSRRTSGVAGRSLPKPRRAAREGACGLSAP